MPAPFEIIAGPIQAWVAPLATAFPLISAAPAATWILLGQSGDDNMTESGLTIRHGQETNPFFALGTTLARKVFRSRESHEVEFNIADLTMELYNKAMGTAATTAGDVVDVAAGAGTAGYRHFDLERGFDIDTVALLLRTGMSPYGDAFNTQWEIKAAQLHGQPELVFVKDVPVALNFVYTVIKDPAGGVSIRCLAQDAIPA